jgi:hypothetical protein
MRRVQAWLLIASALLGFTATLRAAAAASPVLSLAVPGRANATPWIAASGSFVAVAWGAGDSGKTDVFVAISRDGARTFGAPVQVNAIAGEARLGGEMPPRVVLRRHDGAADPEVSVLWTARGQGTEIRMARSRDGGRTFAAPVTLQSSGAAGDRGWPALALDAQGVAHAIWLDHRGLARPVGQKPHANHHEGSAADGVAMAQKSGLYYAALGAAASPERALAMGVCYCCKTAIVAGADGALFAAWRHVYPGNLRDIAFSASRDGGRSFAPPVRVSEDDWSINGCPDDGPAMALDTSGTVHVVWPTVVKGPTPEGALFYASSRDGRTFGERVRVPTLGSPKPSHPQIAIDGRGRIVIAWDESVDGQRVAALRELRRDPGDRISFGNPVMLAAQGPAVYPVVAPMTTGLAAAWTAGSGASSTIGVRAVPVP